MNECKVVPDVTINQAVGAELRRIRDGLGLTRGQVVQRMSPTVLRSVQTLSNYETGIRPLTLPILTGICEALGVATASVVGLALQRADIEEHPDWILVDLAAAVKAAVFPPPLMEWARKRRKHNSGSDVVKLDMSAVEEIAILVGTPVVELLATLRQFSPAHVPVRVEATVTE